eukprot:m.139434 g.139434  ORF g.139434 m.139434 type:complete len:57 (-) comp15945_c0_seq5:2231-2401(-)
MHFSFPSFASFPSFNLSTSSVASVHFQRSCQLINQLRTRGDLPVYHAIITTVFYSP